MDLHLQLIVLILSMIISNKHESIGQYVPPFTSVVAPVVKHTDSAYNSFYSAKIMTKYVNLQFIHTNFLKDLEAPFTWYACVVQWNSYPGSCPDNTVCLSPISYEEYQCTDVAKIIMCWEGLEPETSQSIWFTLNHFVPDCNC
ncbi:hypothetical protein R6Q57_019035 [Mikania cordata]